MAAPNVTVLWDDQSAINTISAAVEDNLDRPIVMVASSFDKGYEEWTKKVYGDQFEKIYGSKPSFKKHGQIAIQTANLINAGGYATIKRVVADDATLANASVVANVSYSQTKYVDPNTQCYIWESKLSNGTVNRIYAVTSPGTDYKAVMVNQVTVEFEVVSQGDTLNASGKSVWGNDLTAFKKNILENYQHKSETGHADHYILFSLFDTGRGVSNKRFRIYRDTTQSYPITYARYFLEITEDDETLETIAFTINPYVNEYSNEKKKYVNINLQNAIRLRSNQLRCIFFDDEFDAMAKNISYLLNTNTSLNSTTPFKDTVDEDSFAMSDILFGTDLYGEAYDNLTIKTDLDNVYGIPLYNGSNGEFGDCPISANTYTIRLAQAFNAQCESWCNPDDIYDVDNNRIDAIFDANYPPAVKNAIEQLVIFREDCLYFRDFGTEVNSIAAMKSFISTNNITNSRFCASYCNYYDIYDPFTYKQETVTVMYHLVRLFVTHFINGRARPFCGMKYNVILPVDEIVDGTLNFYPKITPSVDQKAEMDTLRINYCNYYDGNVLAVNSCYTSQTAYTQLTWLHNVLAVQEIIKAIRVVCPKIRYTFTDGDDLVKYKNDINDLIINKYASNFKSISIEYVEDDLYDSNKIIYAVIKVQFRNFVQSEIFKITAIQS